MKTAIWDYNGTILDDVSLCLDVERFMLRERGMFSEYTEDDYRDLFCFPVYDYYLKLGYTFEQETYEEVSVEFNELYDTGFARCGLCEGVLETLQKLKELGYRNVIVSACRQDKLLAQTERLGIDGFFEERLGIDNDLAASKIEMARAWMKRAEINPEDCIFIGDTLHDKETADAIGVSRCILVAGGHQSYEVLSCGCDHVVRSLREISF